MKFARRFSLFTTVMAFVVLFQGILVVATEAGDACGTDWPFCNGSVIPDFSDPLIFIEYTHRIVVGMFGFVVLANFLVALRVSKGDRAIRRFAGGSVFFLLATAGAGGMNVLLETPPGFTVLDIIAGLCLLGSLISLTIALRRKPVVAEVGARGSGSERQCSDDQKLSQPSILVLAMVLVEMVVGAFFKHSAASEVLMGIELSERLVESMVISQYLYFFHAILGTVILVSVAYILFLATHFRQLVGAAYLLVGLVLTEMFIGFTMLMSKLPVLFSSLHMIVTLTIFSTGTYIAAKAKLKDTFEVAAVEEKAGVVVSSGDGRKAPIQLRQEPGLE
ncbi:COX15/CtaA family protein [Ammoniphilus resinae]|uniref:Cytochrome c oxidase assembly protein subunit 15 n=1 Tax=Ammoniphilus resinae TaxID=861532 RepID=A0ABS4GWR7_9BACL|nr:COX15/CtaA family protein [Ammoniphilus resinae]MBP1934691.1 cytochrome c oxidase assembly protein subunit 15 [Ammoniphilus resinae]